MNKSNFFYLGFFSKLYSFKGELILRLNTDEPENYSKLKKAYLFSEETLKPFTLERVKEHKSPFSLRVKINGIDSEEEAKSILTKEVFLPLEELPKLTGNKFYFHEVIAFKALDKKSNLIGTIRKIRDYDFQAVFEILKDGKEILVPVHDSFIVEVNRKEKYITLDLPEGLIEIYT